MSKPLQNHKYHPLRQQEPDYKNKSILQGTTSPVKQVKLYLEKAKKNQKDSQSKNIVLERVADG